MAIHISAGFNGDTDSTVPDQPPMNRQPVSQTKAAITRRKFIRTTSAAMISMPAIIPASALGRDGKPPPSERINLGIIGVGGMGRSNLENCARHYDVVVTGICDVWKQRRDMVLDRFKTSARGHSDYRELLARPDLDGVIIATPPHWHALIAIDAAEAGKDFYLQKPMTLYPDETLAVRNAVRQHNRVTQIGTQIHSGSNYRRVVEWIRSGKLGPITAVRTFNVMNQGPNGIGHAPDEPPPQGLDWPRWLGPAPERQYNRLIAADAHSNCSFWDYSGGWTPGMAPHIIDLPIWALELGPPLLTSSFGGRYTIRDQGDAPDTQHVLWNYGNLTMTWAMSCCNSFGFDFGRGSRERRLGTYFHGLYGTLFANYSKYEIVAEGDFLKDSIPPSATIPDSPGHEREWLDCIKSRQQPSCSVEYHWKVDLAITLANLSLKVGRTLRFDPERDLIIGDNEAQKIARPVYRSPWKFPATYCSGTVAG